MTSGEPPAPAPAILVRDLHVSRGGARILHGIDLAVPAGTILGLLGPSGCGKTTLMRTVVGVQRIASGSVDVLGHPAGDRAMRGRIGYVTQENATYSDITVRDNVAYFAALQGAHAQDMDATIRAVGLEEQSRRSVATLSGGQAGRVSLACALVVSPPVLVLDEPTVGLDPLTREDLWAQFRGLAERGHTLVVSSHVMDEATRCDRLALMRDGRLLGTWTPESLLASTNTDSPDAAFLALVRRDATRHPRTPPDARQTPPDAWQARPGDAGATHHGRPGRHGR